MTHRAGMFALMKDLACRPPHPRFEAGEPARGNLWVPIRRPWRHLCRCWMWCCGLETFFGLAAKISKIFTTFSWCRRKRARRNSMAMTLSRAEASTFSCFPKDTSSEQKFIPALNSMAMGDVNSVEYGQQSHFRLAQHLGLKTSDFLTLRGRTPRQDWAVGIVIDDLVIVEQMPAEQPSSSVAAEVADGMVAVYHQVGLKPNDKKRVQRWAAIKILGNVPRRWVWPSASTSGEGGAVGDAVIPGGSAWMV